MTRESATPERGAEPEKGRHDLAAAKVFESQELFSGQREVLIRHAGDIYRLRITRKGKLILYK